MSKFIKHFLFIATLLIFYIFSDYFNLDLKILKFFVQEELVKEHKWPWIGLYFPIFQVVFYGTLIPTIYILLKETYKLFKSWRAQEAINANILLVWIILNFGINGILINLVSKNTIPRPRPKEIAQYMGLPGVHYWTLKDVLTFKYKNSKMHTRQYHNGKNYFQSFPSGHASLAFAFLGLVFWIFLNQGVINIKLLIFGLIWSIFIAQMRMSQGGHYFSDIITSLWLNLYIPFLLIHIKKFLNKPFNSSSMGYLFFSTVNLIAIIFVILSFLKIKFYYL